MAQRQVRQRQLLYVSDSVDADYDLDTESDLDRRSSRLLVEAVMVEAVMVEAMVVIVWTKRTNDNRTLNCKHLQALTLSNLQKQCYNSTMQATNCLHTLFNF